jgi:hypothetical protein
MSDMSPLDNQFRTSVSDQQLITQNESFQETDSQNQDIVPRNLNNTFPMETNKNKNKNKNNEDLGNLHPEENT